jgi:hypothetical protein
MSNTKTCHWVWSKAFHPLHNPHSLFPKFSSSFAVWVWPMSFSHQSPVSNSCPPYPNYMPSTSQPPWMNDMYKLRGSLPCNTVEPQHKAGNSGQLQYLCYEWNWHLFWVLSSRTQCNVVYWNSTNVLEEHAVFIFTFKSMPSKNPAWSRQQAFHTHNCENLISDICLILNPCYYIHRIYALTKLRTWS